MWTCESCGAQGIAGDLVACPVCGTARAVESADGNPTEQAIAGARHIEDTYADVRGEHGPELTGLPPGQAVDTGAHADTDDEHEEHGDG